MIKPLAALAACLLWSVHGSAAIESQPRQQPPASVEPEPLVLTRAPELVHFVNATYPESLLLNDVAGEVLLYIDIDEAGNVARVEVVESTYPEFRRPALVAATQFQFIPAEINHQAAEIRIEYRYIFEPQVPQPDAIAGAASPVQQSAAVSVPPTIDVEGWVREAGNRNPLGNVVISVNGRPVTESDAQGRFVLRGAPVGEIKIKLSSPTHQEYEVLETRQSGEKLEARYYLLRKSNNPFETVVRSRADRREVTKIQLSREELKKVPGTFGDPVRVIENLPGMARTPGGLGGALLVRGARPQDSRVYFDGVEVPILFHFGGLTSVVNSEFIESIDFFPGGFGARYGRATAGIVEITTRDLDCDLVRGVGKVDLVDAAIYGCAPAGEWYVAAAGRRSYVDVLLGPVVNALTPEDGASLVASPVYYDYQAKAHTRVGRHAFDIFAFGSHDRFRLVQSGSVENVDVELGLTTTFHRLMGRHRYRRGDGFSITSTVAPGYDLRGFDLSASGGNSNARVGLWSVDWREDLMLKLADGLVLNAGLDHRFGTADFGLEFPMPTELRRFPSPTFDYTRTQSLDLRLNDFGQAYWLELVADLPGNVRLVPGIRFDRFHFSQTQDFAVQPRLTARWKMLESTTLKGAYGIYEKLPEPAYLVESIGNPNLRPERAQHFVFGVEQGITELVSLDLQLFYVLRDRFASLSNTTRNHNGTQQPEIWSSTGRGRSYGLELMLRHLATPEGWFYGWIAYTLSRTFRQDHAPGSTFLVEAADGSVRTGTYSDRATAWYPAPFDQPHILTVVGQFVLPWGLEAGLRFRLVSGNPTTPFNQGFAYFDADENAYRNDLNQVPRNSDRMPTFHQLDLRIDKTWTFNTWKFAAYLEVINVYNARNVEAFQYDFRFRERAPITFLPILPVLGVRGEF